MPSTKLSPGQQVVYTSKGPGASAPNFAPLSGKQNEVSRVYVVNRSLEGAHGAQKGRFTHSGLLVQTKDGKFYNIEYGVKDAKGNPNNVAVRAVDPASVSKTQMSDGGRTWTKQGVGQAPGKPGATVADYAREMHNFGAKGDYSTLGHNCHKAQRAAREAMGHNVPPAKLFE